MWISVIIFNVLYYYELYSNWITVQFENFCLAIYAIASNVISSNPLIIKIKCFDFCPYYLNKENYCTAVELSIVKNFCINNDKIKFGASCC